MNSFRQVSGFFMMMGLAIMLAITITFNFGNTDSWAAELPLQSTGSSIQIATQNQARANQKELEGKVQEGFGKATNNRQEQLIGKSKQVESQVRNAIEDVKNNIQDAMN
ncbi:CsbD family protein [Candidatus Synechococcus calcipolaris G9]|uniref:CsbD family protein n=1 Tax=Candidatus Synechococcus calcipolaris G9 TaxID=1497997 RepID=A0ABT6EWK9_9SYNE|nr:CsbD family protein [Candidatus Synechococcus calcipolaris]MDG2990160.1 CsbD family protein [Candidatus Synechococcus calcipolaris G9]